MNRSIRLACVILLGLQFSNQRLQAAEPDPARVTTEGFSFVPPTGWLPSSVKIGDIQVGPTTVHTFLIYNAPTNGGFANNVNVNTTPDIGTSPENLAKTFYSDLPRAIPGLKVVEQKFVQVDGRIAFWQHSVAPGAGKQIELLQYVIPGVDGKLYTVTYTTAPQDFLLLQDSLHQSAGSIQFVLNK